MNSRFPSISETLFGVMMLLFLLSLVLIPAGLIGAIWWTLGTGLQLVLTGIVGMVASIVGALVALFIAD